MKKITVQLFIILTVIAGLVACENGSSLRDIRESAGADEMTQVKEKTAPEMMEASDTGTVETSADEEPEGVLEKSVEDADEPDDTESEPMNENIDAWKDAYAEVVKQWNWNHYFDGEVWYDLAYIDDDNIPELALFCNDGDFYAMDMYTYVNGTASHMQVYDMEGKYDEWRSEHVSPGRQMQGDSYCEREGIYIQSGGSMGNLDIIGYRLSEDRLDQVFHYRYDVTYSEDDPETASTSYLLEYLDNTGQLFKAEHEIKEEEDYYSLESIPEAEDLENELGFSLEKEKAFAELTFSEIMGKLYEKQEGDSWQTVYTNYLYDVLAGVEYILDIHEAYNYNGAGKLYFSLKDINGDGIPELWFTDDEDAEYRLWSIFTINENNELSDFMPYDIADSMAKVYDPDNNKIYAVPSGLYEYYALFKIEGGKAVGQYVVNGDEYNDYYLSYGSENYVEITKEEFDEYIREYEEAEEKYLGLPDAVEVNAENIKMELAKWSP